MGSFFSRQTVEPTWVEAVDVESQTIDATNEEQPSDCTQASFPAGMNHSNPDGTTVSDTDVELSPEVISNAELLDNSFHDKLCIVAICGAMNSGKDTIAAELQSQLKETCKVSLRSFGSYVKDHICNTFNINLELIESWKRVDVAPPTFDRPMRELLQHVGDLRTFQPTYWVNKLLRELPSSGLIIVTDVRYENELQALKQRGAYVLSVVRPSLPAKNASTPHSSENELVKWIDECFESTESERRSHTRCISVDSEYFDALFVNCDDGMARLRSACAKETLRIITHFITNNK
jgi:hypothetical protein